MCFRKAVNRLLLSSEMQNRYGSMMAQFGFDTLSFVKRLSAAGMDSRQAAALAEAFAEHAFDALVTKSDLKSALKELELRLTLRTGAIAVASVAILGTLIAAS